MAGSDRSGVQRLRRLVVRSALLVGVAAAVTVLLGEAGLTAGEADERILYNWAKDSGPEGAPLRFLDPRTGSWVERLHVSSDAGWRASPDGTQLVLTGGSALQLADADGSNPVQLTAQGSFPAWSPDGAQIASFGTSGSAIQIMIMDATLGSVPVSLADLAPGVRGGGLDWSPDGETLVWSWFETTNNTSGIELLTIADKTGVSVGEGHWPRFSLDGGSIAFLNKVVDPAIGIMTASGTGRVVHAQKAQTLAWSPDGTSIAWADRHLLGVYDPESKKSEVLIAGFPGETNLYVADWAGLVLPTFADVPYDHTFSFDVEWAAAEGVTKGCNPPANDRFCPNDTVTRGQLAAFLNRALELPIAAEDAFVDDAGSIFEDDINRLASAGITKGCNPPARDRFCPDGLVTRGEMAAFLVRAIGYTDGGGGDLFVDDDGSVFEGDIDRLGIAKVTRGCNPPVNDRFCPTDPVTRAQIAAFLHRAVG